MCVEWGEEGGERYSDEMLGVCSWAGHAMVIIARCWGLALPAASQASVLFLSHSWVVSFILSLKVRVDGNLFLVSKVMRQEVIKCSGL